MIKSVFFFVLINNFCCCLGQTGIQNAGVIINRMSFYDSAKNKFVSDELQRPQIKTWFKDSVAIQELSAINIAKQEGIPVNRKAAPKYYVFTDLRNMDSYVYLNFSDTAKIYKTSKFGKEKKFDISFDFDLDNKLEITTAPTALPDTSIQGVLYKRINYIQSLGGANGDRINTTYFRCDKKNVLFPLYKYISDEIGCPMVVCEHFIPKTRNGKKTELLFVSDTLRRGELKVFKAWEKYAKDNPVK